MAEAQSSTERQLWLEKFYLRNVAFVATQSPERFSGTVDAEAQLNVRSAYRDIDDKYVEVLLTVRVKSVARGEEVFRVELTQGGVFTVQGFTPEERERVLGSACPAMLYPFARQAIAGIARKAGFSDLSLRPLDFDTMYYQNLQERSSQGDSDAPQTPQAEEAGPA